MNRIGYVLVAGLAVGITIMTLPAQSQQSVIPKDMVYVGQGPSLMGLDQAEPATSNRRLTAYEKRMKTAWSAEAFHDEGPAHMVFLDSFLIDKYEVSNKDYGEFIKTTGHPAPAYWDDPRLNKPQQPVVGVNWNDAKAYCEFAGSGCRQKRNGKRRLVVHMATSIPGGTTSIPRRQITTSIMMRPCRWTLIRREPVTTVSITWPAMSSSGSPIGMIHSITAGFNLW